MYTVTVAAVYKLRGAADVATDDTTVNTKVGSLTERDLENGIAKLYRDVLATHPGCELFSVCHTVTK